MTGKIERERGERGKREGNREEKRGDKEWEK